MTNYVVPCIVRTELLCKPERYLWRNQFPTEDNLLASELNAVYKFRIFIYIHIWKFQKSVEKKLSEKQI